MELALAGFASKAALTNAAGGVNLIVPLDELTRIYKRFIEYQRFINDRTSEGSFFDRTLFKDLHSALFFDLKDQRNDMLDGSQKLKFSYTLDGAPTACVEGSSYV